MPLPVASRPFQEVAVVRHPIADARHVVVGYELRFGGSVDLGDPAMDAKATSALLVEAFGDIGLETLAGRHPAWVTIARNFLVEIGPPPVRPDRAVLQIKAYHARDDLLQILQRLARSGYTIALDEYDGASDRQRRGADGALLDRARRRLQDPGRRPRPRAARAQDAGRAARRDRGRRPRRLRALQGRSASPTSRASTSPSRASSGTRASPPPASARCAAWPS